jgi:MFS family permease
VTVVAGTPASCARLRAGDLHAYAIVTGAYWADTIADGAIRMLVLFYTFAQGFSPFKVAMLFLGYEIFGVVTNLFGGWLAARFGLRSTLLGGLGAQLIALGMLGLAPHSLLVVPYVMVAQSIGGIAKDLTKMSSKSAVKLVAPDGEGALYRWVAVLTGSKYALKGLGFFVGALLLTLVGFRASLVILAGVVLAALVMAVVMLHGPLGRPDAKAKFRQIFSSDRAINVLAAARIFLFASRDVWFVVALPVFFESEHHWSFWTAGGFLAVLDGRLRHRPGFRSASPATARRP